MIFNYLKQDNVKPTKNLAKRKDHKP